MEKQHIMQQDLLSWKVALPYSLDQALLSALVALRGEILYNNGERPAFFDGTRVIPDDDNLDATSYHLLMFDRHNLVGGVRLTIIDANTRSCILFDLMGAANYRDLIASYGNSRIIEASRLFIVPEYRTTRNIMRLYAGAFFVGFSIAKADILLSANGVKRKHDQFVMSIYEAEPAFDFPEPFWVPKYNDAVRVVCAQLNTTPYKIKKYLEEFQLRQLTAATPSYAIEDLVA